MNGCRPLRSLIPALFLCLLPTLAGAQFTGIYTFTQQAEGCCANQPGMLAQGTDGNLYGTLPQGGTGNAGAWLQYNMSGYPMLPNFGNTSTGFSNSNSGFTLGIDGNLYGGVSNVDSLDHGAIMRLAPASPGLSPTGPPTLVYPFPGGTTGSIPNATFPVAPPIQGTDLNLYGVTDDGNYTGHVYQVLLNTSTGVGTSGWNYLLPSQSLGPLLLGSDGNFYGTYVYGSFDDTTGLPNPGGEGGIFQITPAGVFGWHHNLTGGADGGNPMGGLIQGADGYLYGTASGGGATSTSKGVIFKIALNGSWYSVVHSFEPGDGQEPHGGLVQGSDGYLYGATTSAGPALKIRGLTSKTVGTLFKVTTSNTNYTVLIPFFGTGYGDVGPGTDPESTPTLHTNGRIYGLTHTGGESSNGAQPGNPGASNDAGEFYSYDAGLSPFISIVGQRSAHVGDRVGIIGQGFSNPIGGAIGVTFGGVAVPWQKANVTIWSDHYMTVTVPTGAKTGPVTVQETTGSYSTLYNFTVTIKCGVLCIPLH